MSEKEKNGESTYGDKLTLQEYCELSSQLDEAMEFDCINGLNSDNEIYPKLGHHLTRIYETDFKDLNDEERIILLQSLMRVGGKVGPS